MTLPSDCGVHVYIIGSKVYHFSDWVGKKHGRSGVHHMATIYTKMAPNNILAKITYISRLHF